MSGDETFVLWVCAGLAIAVWFVWYRDLLVVARRPSGAPERRWLALAPLAAVALLAAVLRWLAASDVRNDPAYLGFYLMMGAAWIGGGVQVLSYFGLGARDDVIERGNRAAAMAIAGAVLGITLCFAGGNIGEGPGWWVVVFCAGLSTGALLLFWSFLDRLSGVADTVTIDRDPAAGVRAAGFFAGAGLILGRAAAGNWEGSGPAMFDFVLNGWPVVVLLVLAALLERRFRPSPEALERPVLTHGALPALLYLGLGAAAAGMAGSWM
ncbi:MAG TPA: hypothetical protein VEW48_12990 [Thermoanaerobaculia bacterium]|nr:hypothetical protein [Thermoanaerobaculia bacterium]